MNYQLNREQLEEMVLCIVHNQLDENEAMEYALSVCGEFTYDDAEVVWPEETRIDRIGQNGNDGEHYKLVADTGVYEA